MSKSVNKVLREISRSARNQIYRADEVFGDGDRQIHVKFREDILRLVQGSKVA